MLSHLSSTWSCMNKKHTMISVFLLRNAKFLNFKKKFCLFILPNLFRSLMPLLLLLASFSSNTGSHAHDPLAWV